MKITIDNFQGIAPKISPDKLPPGGAQVAENCYVGGKDLRPIRKPLRTAGLSNSAYQGLFVYKHGATSEWVALTDDVDVVRSPMNQDTYERLYYSGQAEPRVIANDILSTPFSIATDFYKLGIPAPTSAPTVERSGTTTRYYTYTFINAYGEEGPPIAPVGGTDVNDSTPTLTTLQACPEDRRITGVRIYRTSVGTAGTAEFRFVCEATYFSESTAYVQGDYVIYSATPSTNTFGLFCTNAGGHAAGAWNATHFTAGDAIADGDLGELLTTTDYDPPPAGLEGLLLHPGGFLVGFKGNVLYCSEPYLPYAWPEKYQKPVSGTIVGIGIVGDTIFALTDGYPWLFSGTAPDQMTKIVHPKMAPCLSKRSIASTERGVFYASYEGLMQATTSGIDNATKDVFRPDQWQEYYPAYMFGNYYQGKYFGWYNSGIDYGCMVMDMENGNVTRVNLKALAGYLSTDGKYYLVMEEDGDATTYCVKEWEGDQYNLLSYNWKSGKIVTGQKSALSVMRTYIDNDFYDAVIQEQEDNDYLVDLNKDLFDDSTPSIIGTASTFTGAPGNVIDVTLNGIVYNNIDVSGCTDVQGVAAAINARIGTTRATVTTGGLLKITGGIDMMNVTVSDGVVASLFSSAAGRQDGGASLGGKLNDSAFNSMAFNGNSIQSVRDLDINSSITVRLYSDGEQRAEKTISDDNIYRVPMGYRGDIIEIAVSGNIPVRKAEAASSAASIMGE